MSMELTLNSCSIGKSLNESCHATKFTRKRGLKALSELDADEKDLLEIRCNILLTSEDTICFHHEQMYIHKYSNWQLTCRDPSQKQEKNIL